LELKDSYLYILLSAVIIISTNVIVTLLTKHSGAVYCNRSCLWRVGGRCRLCYHDNSKLRASIFTKLGQ